eukprot:CAMPEP_0181448726 /NCGR_PEP_ID=MMETSP1110-20121109/27288_1 /TAXON_ID=174948 /ORGANISM="Symbiodinium sp., Strain CCMP421" /LENGTH=70 /DNA_ID=CAMNT_0023572883 /DNA_START=294 /DNA_END=506 /DNA_ORIENTATION=-
MIDSLATYSTSWRNTQRSSFLFLPPLSSSSISATSTLEQTLQVKTSSIFSFLPIIQLELLQSGQNLNAAL